MPAMLECFGKAELGQIIVGPQAHFPARMVVPPSFPVVLKLVAQRLPTEPDAMNDSRYLHWRLIRYPMRAASSRGRLWKPNIDRGQA